MTGIERLRALAYKKNFLEPAEARELDAIADQIESELQEERDRWDSELCEAQMDKSRVTAVYLEMNKHVIGHEGMEDSPVARWARVLREALGGDGRDHAADVSVSAYDLLPEEDREALAWVCDHGGLENVRDAWDEAVNLCATIGCEPNDESEMLQALGDCTDIVIKRLMPEGMEWMLWDDGKPVTYDDAPDDVIGVYLALDGSGYVLMTDLPDQLMSEPSERVKRPAVLAADGEPLEVGQTVWDANGDELVIVALEDGGHTVTCRYADVGDGIPTHGMWSPSDLTHQRPDSWERIEEDARLKPLGYVDRVLGWDMSKSHSQNQARSAMTRDLVRRAKALAERERSE